jgi:hypothetical protein
LPRPLDGNGDGIALPDIGAFEAAAVPLKSPNARFVDHLYRDLLGRVPDPAGESFWAGLLDRDQANRYQVAWAIAQSPEHHLLEVQDLYRRLLRREADASGLVTWVNFLDRGGTAEGLEARLLGSEEYFARIGGGTAAGFLQALYGDVLHRALDPTGTQGWGSLMAAGASPTDIAIAVLKSLESDLDEVQALYGQFLHRAADPVGLVAFTGVLQAGVPDELAAMLVLGSQEYYQNAQ